MRNTKFLRGTFKKATTAFIFASLLMSSPLASFAANPTTYTSTDGANNSWTDQNGKSPEAEVKGGQTTDVVFYKAEIEWGTMTFVYDRGTYNTIDSKIEKADSTKDGREAKKDTTDARIINCWYGFDGVNNKVTVKNLSSEVITATANANANGTNKGDVAFQLYFPAESSSWTSTGDLNDQYAVSHDNSGSKNTNASTMKTYGGTTLNTELSAQTFNDQGTVTTNAAGSSDSFYLNITGAPAAALTTEATGETLGTITVNLAKKTS